MNQRAVQHPGHDLHVAVRMGFESGAGRDGVVVVDHEHAVVRVAAQGGDSRIERMASVQPADPGLMAIRAAAKARTRARRRRRTHLASWLLNHLNSHVKSWGTGKG